MITVAKPTRKCDKCSGLYSQIIGFWIEFLRKGLGFKREKAEKLLTDRYARAAVINLVQSFDYFGIKKPISLTAPFLVVWDFTHKCNLQCKHCYSNSGAVEEEEFEGGSFWRQAAQTSPGRRGPMKTVLNPTRSSTRFQPKQESSCSRVSASGDAAMGSGVRSLQQGTSFLVTRSGFFHRATVQLDDASSSRDRSGRSTVPRRRTPSSNRRASIPIRAWDGRRVARSWRTVVSRIEVKFDCHRPRGGAGRTFFVASRSARLHDIPIRRVGRSDGTFLRFIGCRRRLPSPTEKEFGQQIWPGSSRWSTIRRRSGFRIQDTSIAFVLGTNGYEAIVGDGDATARSPIEGGRFAHDAATALTSTDDGIAYVCSIGIVVVQNCANLGKVDVIPLPVGGESLNPSIAYDGAKNLFARLGSKVYQWSDARRWEPATLSPFQPTRRQLIRADGGMEPWTFKDGVDSTLIIRRRFAGSDRVASVDATRGNFTFALLGAFGQGDRRSLLRDWADGSCRIATADGPYVVRDPGGSAVPLASDAPARKVRLPRLR